MGTPPGVSKSGPGDWGVAADQTPAANYRIDPDRSRLQIFVFRAGSLARFGHSHIISGEQLNGRLLLGAPLGLSQVELMLPVASLVVDDPEQRRAAGPEFQSVPKPQDIAATRRNMLGPRVLDAAQYPLVRVRGRLIGGRLPDFEAELAIEVRGAVRRIVVPVRVEIGPVEIVAVGELRLRQSDFGIQPYSVLMGNLRVQDEFLIRYRLVAVRN